ncbi:hypothetical protein L249_5786, partial [Ophiocordyceps polyrhachis-furcata BCC 54312]
MDSRGIRRLSVVTGLVRIRQIDVPMPRCIVMTVRPSFAPTIRVPSGPAAVLPLRLSFGPDGGVASASVTSLHMEEGEEEGECIMGGHTPIQQPKAFSDAGRGLKVTNDLSVTALLQSTIPS